MPKPKYSITNTLIRGLKWYLDVKVGFIISNQQDCRKVSELIKIETGGSISDSTLYRVFLWQKNQNTPYLHTLEILAQYIGYSSWRTLEKEIIEMNNFQFSLGIMNEQKNYSSLLKLCIHTNSLRPLQNYLEQFPTEININNKFLIGHELFDSLKSNPNNNIDFFKKFNNIPIVRASFFEIMADPDFSIPHYEQGLMYYLENSKPHQSTQSLQDYIFANSMLLRYYFKTNKKTNLLAIGKRLYKELELSPEELDSLYIFPKIRYLSYKLYYLYELNGFDHDYWNWLKHSAISLAENGDFDHQRIIVHTVLDTLEINPGIQSQTYDEFSILFPKTFERFPEYVKTLPLSRKIKFLDPNASTSYVKSLIF